MIPDSTVESMRSVFHAVTLACVPQASRFTAEQWAVAEAIVDDALALRPPGVRRQVLLFARILDVLSVIRYRRWLSDLEPLQTRSLLASLEKAPVLLLRRGTWGLRTLCFMGVYAQKPVQAALGYSAEARGWAGRGGGMGPWSGRNGAAPPEPGTLTAGGGPSTHPDASEDGASAGSPHG